MDAARRDRYLAALGVVRYRPRPAHVVPAVTAPARTVPDERVQPAPPAIPDVEPYRSRVLAEQVPPTPVERPPLTAASEPAPNPSAAAPVALRLACWQPVPDLLVLDALPPGGWPDRERTALLANILRAIGRLPGPLAAAEVIDWPPFAGAEATLADARESLALFLAGRRVQAPFRWLLAMGEMSWRCLGAEPPQDVGDRFELAAGVQAILLPGLAELLVSPERKAATWRAIRPLAPVPGP